jgi:hypothetical protein
MTAIYGVRKREDGRYEAIRIERDATAEVIAEPRKVRYEAHRDALHAHEREERKGLSA